MNFKEALIAHLQGENVESRHKAKQSWDWAPLGENFKKTPLVNMINNNFDLYHEFRLAPRTAMCNGVEVPAPKQCLSQALSSRQHEAITNAGLAT